MTNCAVLGCMNNSRKKVRMFTFPTNLELRASWLKSIEIKNLNLNDLSAVCQYHFAPKMWNKHKENGKLKFELKCNAVPTIFGEAVKQVAEVTKPQTQTTTTAQNEKTCGAKSLTAANEKKVDSVIEEGDNSAATEQFEVSPTSKDTNKVLSQDILQSYVKIDSVIKGLIGGESTMKNAKFNNMKEVDMHYGYIKLEDILRNLNRSILPNKHIDFSSFIENVAKTGIPESNAAAPSENISKVDVSNDSDCNSKHSKSCEFHDFSEVSDESDESNDSMEEMEQEISNLIDNCNDNDTNSRSTQRLKKLEETCQKSIEIIEVMKTKMYSMRKKIKKLERQSDNQYSKIPTCIRKILNDDQIQALSKKYKKVPHWSEATLTKANELKNTIGASGYLELVDKKIPLPSLRTLNKLRLES